MIIEMDQDASTPGFFGEEVERKVGAAGAELWEVGSIAWPRMWQVELVSFSREAS